jgi:hypothetical protein
MLPRLIDDLEVRREEARVGGRVRRYDGRQGGDYCCHHFDSDFLVLGLRYGVV